MGTDYDAIRKTFMGRIDPAADPDAFLSAMAEYAALGVDLVTIYPMSEDPVAWTTTVCEDVLPRLAEV